LRAAMQGDLDIWPLRLIDFDDPEQSNVVYKLLKYLPEAIHHYLRVHIYPPVLRHQVWRATTSVV
jgi:hypothetical protein